MAYFKIFAGAIIIGNVTFFEKNATAFGNALYIYYCIVCFQMLVTLLKLIFDKKYLKNVANIWKHTVYKFALTFDPYRCHCLFCLGPDREIWIEILAFHFPPFYSPRAVPAARASAREIWWSSSCEICRRPRHFRWFRRRHSVASGRRSPSARHCRPGRICLDPEFEKTVVCNSCCLENSENFLNFAKSSKIFGEFLNFLGFSKIF